jgi:hypothetical protein
MAYDALKKQSPSRGHKEYLQILHLAARESESLVDESLRHLIKQNRPITAKAVEEAVRAESKLPAATDVTIAQVELTTYDQLLDNKEVA